MIFANYLCKMDQEVQESVGERRRRGMWVVLKQLRPYFLSLLACVLSAGFNIISKVALEKGLSRYVLVVYGHAIGGLVTAVLALIFERKNRIKIDKFILCHIFFSGFLGVVLGRTLFYAGLESTTSTFAAALGNILPSMTIILAVICRMEKLNVFKISGQAKIWGTLVAFAGATLMTLYKGVAVISLPSGHSPSPVSSNKLSHKDWIKGPILLITSYSSLAAFCILQTTTIKKYPSLITLTSLTCLMGTLQAAVMTLILEHKASSWRLNWDFSLLVAIYNGFVYGVSTYLQIWVIQEKGPVFTTAFKPLSTVMVAVLALFVLGEAFHLGGIIGTVMIFIGLYVILWGKAKEKVKAPMEIDLSREIESSSTSGL